MQLFVDNLTNIDFSYLDPQRGLLGQTWLTNIQMQGGLDNQGMICDFGIVKKTLRNWLDNEIDHRLLVPCTADNLTLTDQGDYLTLQWLFGNGQKLYCRSPKQAITLVDSALITPETLSHWCVGHLHSQFSQSIEQLQLSFQPEEIPGASYQYSHGLKKHNGNCQRIAHGHRSRIHIWINDTPSPQLEQQWAERWRDIYIATREDLLETPPTDARAMDKQCEYHFAYQAQQGVFELSLPKDCCYLVETDTTVEFLADHIAQTLKSQMGNARIKVQAFEGLGKGAIAEY